MSLKDNKSSKFADFLPKLSENVQKVSKQSLAALVIGFALFSAADPSVAASSGGRSGGSSFRSSARSSYSPPRSSTRLNSYSSSTTIIPVPSYSPFYSPFSFGFSPFFSPFSVVSPNVLIIGLVAYAAYSLLKNRQGGSDFQGNDEDYGSLGTGATVVNIQIALDSDWSESNNIMRVLSELGNRNSDASRYYNQRSELASLLSEASLALLRRQDRWTAASIKGERFKGSAQKAEPYFQNLAIKERSKFESESTSNNKFGGMLTSNPNQFGGLGRTQAVVSLVCAIRGQSEALKSMRSASDVTAALQALASEAMTDEGDNIMAVEVLWTPSEPGETLNAREMVVDYPELIKL